MADRPPGVRGFCSRCSMAIVEAGEGMTGVFLPAVYLFGHTPHDKYGICFTIRRNNGGSSTQWHMEKTISIGFESKFMGSMGRHLLIYHFGSSSLEAGCFTLDHKTFQLEWVCAKGPIPKSTHAYCNFPPSILSSPTVSSVTGHADHRGVRNALPMPDVSDLDPPASDSGDQERQLSNGSRGPRGRGELLHGLQATN